MNRLIVSLTAFAFAFAASAAMDDVVITFSTPGTDRYADGTAVLDGECYALVHTPAGKTFSGFAADGSVADPSTGSIVLCAPVAKGGRCPLVAFELGAAEVAAKYPSGIWGVYLLDTRKFGADGSATPSGLGNGKPSVVNASGLVTYGKVSAAGGDLMSGTAGVTSGETEVPEGTPRPRITDIKVVDGMVYVTVRDTVSYINYTLKEGAQPSAVVSAPGQDTRAGEEGKEIILVSPAKGGKGFYSVGRK